MTSTEIKSLEKYVAYFTSARLPVLRRTAADLAELQKDEDNVSGRSLASVVLQDPLMTLRVLAHLEAHRRRSQNHDITTIERAIMMMGVTPFFRTFADLPIIEEQLAEHPKALIGVLRVITRARHASHYARDWATLRHDLDVDEVTVAALLHEVAEILLWCFAPARMRHVAQTLQDTPGLRSAVAQEAVLGVTVRDLQLALVRAWHLPELFSTLMDEAQANNPRVRNVLLACNLARHAANGWDDPALPDDYVAIARLLRMQPAAIINRLGVPEENQPDMEPLQAAFMRGEPDED